MFSQKQIETTEEIFETIDNIEEMYRCKVSVFEKLYAKGRKTVFSTMPQLTNEAKQYAKLQNGNAIDLRFFSPTYYRQLLNNDYKNFVEFKKFQEFMPEI